MSAGPMAAQLPPPAAVEVGDEGEETVGGGVDLGGQDDDLLFQLLQGVAVVGGVGDLRFGVARSCGIPFVGGGPGAGVQPIVGGSFPDQERPPTPRFR